MQYALYLIVLNDEVHFRHVSLSSVCIFITKYIYSHVSIRVSNAHNHTQIIAAPFLIKIGQKGPQQIIIFILYKNLDSKRQNRTKKQV